MKFDINEEIMKSILQQKDILDKLMRLKNRLSKLEKGLK